MKSFKSLLTLAMAMAISSTTFAESTLPTTMLKDTAKQTLDAGKQAVGNAENSAKAMAAADKMNSAKDAAKSQVKEVKQAVGNSEKSAKSAVTDKMMETKEKATKAKEQLKTTKESAKKAGKVNINTADAKTLQSLNGIGEAKAQAIIDYRNKNGKIKDIKELSNVSGIGEATLEKLKGAISF